MLGQCVNTVCWQEGEAACEGWGRDEEQWREKCENYRERAAELQDTVTKLTVSIAVSSL